MLSKLALTGALLGLMCLQGPPLPDSQARARLDALSLAFAFRIQEESLDDALLALADQSGFSVSMSPSDVAAKGSVGLSGTYTVAAALEKLLNPTGLSYRFFAESRSIVITAVPNGQGMLQH
jgi:Secretin and TonB N terminus short domain